MPRSVFFNLLEVSPFPLEAEDPLQTILDVICRSACFPSTPKNSPLTPLIKLPSAISYVT